MPSSLEERVRRDGIQQATQRDEQDGIGDETEMTPYKDDVIEFYEERAAVKEFDGGVHRMNAESAALREVSQKYGAVAARMIKDWRELKGGE